MLMQQFRVWFWQATRFKRQAGGSRQVKITLARQRGRRSGPSQLRIDEINRCA